MLPVRQVIAGENLLSVNVFEQQERNASKINSILNSDIQLFDIVMSVESALLIKSRDLVARTKFTSFGTVPTLVTLVYRIENSDGENVFTENDEITVETEKTVTKEFKNLELGNGEYTLVLTTTYNENVVDEFKQAFKVKGLPVSKTSIWSISICIIVGISGFVLYKFMKRQ